MEYDVINEIDNLQEKKFYRLAFLRKLEDERKEYVKVDEELFKEKIYITEAMIENILNQLDEIDEEILKLEQLL